MIIWFAFPTEVFLVFDAYSQFIEIAAESIQK